MTPSPDRITLAAMGDLHVGEDDRGRYREVFAEVSDQAHVLALCGDLTNFGSLREAENLAEDLRACTIPVVGVLGNHDYECDQADGVARILHQAGVQLLNGEAYEIEGVGFAGCKGFIGGFGRNMLSAFGEPALKAFVQASIDENLKLESSLRMLRSERIAVILHFSPIPETLAGEPLEIFPFLGSSRLAETIDRFEDVRIALHGHAHRGTFEGRTPRGVPVYNVAQPLLRQQFGQPYVLLEV
ncbi:MAG TPA: metallophosphoesterase [Caulobacteraceae bacterium]|nr:metallophosphoesterase [Caulobacteraceae bacterium]